MHQQHHSTVMYTYNTVQAAAKGNFLTVIFLSPYPVPMGGSRLCDGVSQRTCTGALLSSGSLVRRAGVECVVMRSPEKLHVYCPDTSEGKLCTCMVS